MSKYITFGQKYHKGEKKVLNPWSNKKRLKRFLPPGRRSKLKQLIKNKKTKQNDKKIYTIW